MRYRLFIDDVCRRAVLHEEHCELYAERPERLGMEYTWSATPFASEDEARRAVQNYAKEQRAAYQFSVHSCVRR